MSKILLNLNIFPGLVSNLQIKSIIEYIETEKARINMKSPRGNKELDDEKDKFVTYEDFEEILKAIAFKSFITNQNQNKIEALMKLINFIKEPAKIVYSVKLTSCKLKFKSNSNFILGIGIQHIQDDIKALLSSTQLKSFKLQNNDLK